MAGPFYFAWVGGQIPAEPTVLSTTGNTHGVVIDSFTVTGSLLSGFNVIGELQSATSLEPGALYLVSGPGLPDGVFAQYFSGNEVSISINAPTTLSSGTFVLTKTAPIETTTANLHALSGLVDNIGDTSSLVPGTLYWMTGPGVPEGAIFTYQGGNSVDITGLVANNVPLPSGFPPPLPRFVPLGSASNIGVLISGFADEGATTTITNLANLSQLTPGLRYNISGPGIQAGSTFVAPFSGTSITLDRPATAANVGVPLVITGPRVPNAPFDPVADAREDEKIFGFEIEQAEGDFATLTIDVVNPMVGLLSPGRNLWCWLSWDDGTGTIRPLFNGRLIGVPRRQADQIVQLQFLARPDDFFDQKLALATAMQVLPFWDPVWLEKKVSDPDAVLETYSVLWHIDRTSLEVTTSDIIAGEDGTITIQENQHFYDEFALTYGQPPLTAVTVEGTVTWTQQGEGRIDLTDKVCSAFGAAGSGRAPPLISTLCGDGLKSDWPKGGSAIGGGWNFSAGNYPGSTAPPANFQPPTNAAGQPSPAPTDLLSTPGEPLCMCIDAVQTATNPYGWVLPLFYNVVMAGQQVPSTPSAPATPTSSVLGAWDTFTYQYPVSVYKVRLNVDWKANRKRTETVTAVIAADVQQVLSDPAAADTEIITVTSQYPGEAVDPGNGVPIGDLRRNSYFQLDRGEASFEYLLLLGRAKIRARARAVDLTFTTDWLTALGITLRNSVTLFDRRLPLGAATGKVKSYKLSVPADGSMTGSFTLGCTIGRGSTTAPVPGVDCYALDGYMDDGYQVVTGQQNTLITDELVYQSLDQFVVEDDGIDLFNLDADTAVNELSVFAGLNYQVGQLAGFQNMVGFFNPNAAMALAVTKVTLDLKPVAGSEFSTSFYPAVGPLAVPKTIDLEAAAGG